MTKRIAALAAIDSVLVNLAFFLGLLFTFNGPVPESVVDSYITFSIPLTLIWLASFFTFKLYHKMWEYASIGELVNIVKAVTVGTVCCAVLDYLFIAETAKVLALDFIGLIWTLNFLFIGGSRLAWRIFRDRHLSARNRSRGIPVLIVGAGAAGAMVARELKNHNSTDLFPIGFIDRDKKKHGLQLFGIPVLGDRYDIPRLVKDHSIQEVILAMPSASKKDIRDIIEICQEAKVKVKTLPGVYELIDGKVSVKQIRDIDVEDLLGREPVSVDLESISEYLKGRVVLVTGAGGSIGSELCRQIAWFEPKTLVLLDNYENCLYDVQLELEHTFADLAMEIQVVDIKDKKAVGGVFKKFRPDVVFHAAAHKHVPLMENNAASAVKTNVVGTKNLVEASALCGVDVFIFISTDKAVNPTSVMGASKRLAEIVVQHYNVLSDTRFAAVRFGNVLASKGSVIPIFRQQIARGGPVTVTHPEMTRYFMTIPEAVQLVIQAGAMADGGEIFALDMGEPVNILDLAETVIRLSGFEPYKDIDIVYSGVRPGEKLYEELLTEKEGVNVTRHERIFVSSLENYLVAKLEPFLVKVSTADFPGDDAEAVQILEQLVPGYSKYWVISDTQEISEFEAYAQSQERQSQVQKHALRLV